MSIHTVHFRYSVMVDGVTVTAQRAGIVGDDGAVELVVAGVDGHRRVVMPRSAAIAALTVLGAYLAKGESENPSDMAAPPPMATPARYCGKCKREPGQSDELGARGWFCVHCDAWNVPQ